MNTIWITGGSSGIGFAVAQKFLEENWRVIISSRNDGKLRKAVEKLKQQTIKTKVDTTLFGFQRSIAVESIILKFLFQRGLVVRLNQYMSYILKTIKVLAIKQRL